MEASAGTSDIGEQQGVEGRPSRERAPEQSRAPEAGGSGSGQATWGKYAQDEKQNGDRSRTYNTRLGNCFRLARRRLGRRRNGQREGQEQEEEETVSLARDHGEAGRTTQELPLRRRATREPEARCGLRGCDPLDEGVHDEVGRWEGHVSASARG